MLCSSLPAPSEGPLSCSACGWCSRKPTLCPVTLAHIILSKPKLSHCCYPKDAGCSAIWNSMCIYTAAPCVSACPSQSLVLQESRDNSRLLDFSERWPGADLRAQQRRLWAPHQQCLAAGGYQESTHAAAHPHDHLPTASALALLENGEHSMSERQEGCDCQTRTPCPSSLEGLE